LAEEQEFYKLEDDLPDEIKWKLFLIRQIALAKYRESKGA